MATRTTTPDPVAPVVNVDPVRQTDETLLAEHWVWEGGAYACRTNHDRAQTALTWTEMVVNCRSCRIQVRLPRTLKAAR